ncbi:predicted protein [Naegleria gruberi]|uniref:Predicted protein n=1 Tax=Naegleria gruberi TaxID=5762 RepID=D2VJA7_NAEGR|nr:uncharacterized protein NAEGRDRAFT_68969 [Naegleria gruberi]EFC43163.1 predicted protein [Naegleria gruberi]|eukprot:XP_002675907.1 predicted protein [Naegleria gruberi strain NEG-M]
MVFFRMPQYLKQPTREERTPIKAKKEGRSPLQLSSPTSLFESNGELYIVDNSQGKVYKTLRNGHVVVIAGGGMETKDGKPAHESKLEGPFGICISKGNEVFISEREGNRIRKIDRFGNIYTVAGTGEAGDNEDGNALECKLNEPCGIIINELDQIIFADKENGKIRMIQSDGNIKTLLSETYYITNLCQDESGIIYFATRSTISKLFPNGNVETCERKLQKQTPGKIYPFTDLQSHTPFDIKIRNGIVHYSERLFLRNFDPMNGNDNVLAKLDAVQKPLTKKIHKKNFVAICPSNDGTVYMSDDMRGTIWRQGPQPHVLKELMVKCEIPFNFKDYPHIGPRKRIVERCEKFSDVVISFSN